MYMYIIVWCDFCTKNHNCGPFQHSTHLPAQFALAGSYYMYMYLYLDFFTELNEWGKGWIRGRSGGGLTLPVYIYIVWHNQPLQEKECVVKCLFRTHARLPHYAKLGDWLMGPLLFLILEISWILFTTVIFTFDDISAAFFSATQYSTSLQDNEYVHAIKAVGSVLAPYDSDQLIPAYGFGARMPDGQVSHCFPLNFNPQRPDVYGVQVCTCACFIRKVLT